MPVPGGEQAKSEQRVAIAAADEPEQCARELVEPEQQHAAANEPPPPLAPQPGELSEHEVDYTVAAQPGEFVGLGQPAVSAAADPGPESPGPSSAPLEMAINAPFELEQRVAITIAAKAGSALVEPEQHAAADEPPPPLAPQPGELSEREVDYTVAAQPGEFVGLGQPAVSAATDPGPEGLGPSNAPLKMAINAPTSRSSRTRLRRLARARASAPARAAAADAVAGRANTKAARVARAPNVRAVAQRRPRLRGRGGGSNEAAITIAPESSGAPPGMGVDAPPTRRTRSRCTARTLARAAAAAALASSVDMDVSAPRVARDASRVAAAVSAPHATRAWSAPAAASCGPRGRNGGVAATRPHVPRHAPPLRVARAVSLPPPPPPSPPPTPPQPRPTPTLLTVPPATPPPTPPQPTPTLLTALPATPPPTPVARAAALAAARHAIAAHAAAARRRNTAFSAPRTARGSRGQSSAAVAVAAPGDKAASAPRTACGSRGRNSAAAAPGDTATSAPCAARASGACAKRDRRANQSPVECIVKDVNIVFASVADAQAQNETPRELLDQAGSTRPTTGRVPIPCSLGTTSSARLPVWRRRATTPCRRP